LREIKSWLDIIISRNEITHIHCSGLGSKVIAPLCFLIKLHRGKFIITYHSLRDDVNHLNKFKKLITRIIHNSTTHIIVVSPEIKEKLLVLGDDPEKVSIIPAFLPPIIKEQEIKEIPHEVWNFINTHTPIISANAFRIMHSNGQDRYGIDMCVDLCANLNDDYPEVGFIFCLPEIGDYDYFSRMKQRIAKENIANNFLFVTMPYHYYPILMKSNVFVRPTNTDGDAVSLREALYFQIPSVASDASHRPEGTILFKNRDINDLTLKMKNLLANYEYCREKLKIVRLEDNFEKILGVYQSLVLVKQD
jgi:hypothetical protein